MKSEIFKNLEGEEDLKVVEKKPKKGKQKVFEVEEEPVSVSEALLKAEESNPEPEEEPVEESIKDTSEGFQSLSKNFEGLDQVFADKKEEAPVIENKADQLQAEIAAARKRLENVPVKTVAKKENFKTTVNTERFNVEERGEIEKMFENVKEDERRKLEEVKKTQPIKPIAPVQPVKKENTPEQNIKLPSFWEGFVKFLTPKAEDKYPFWEGLKFWKFRSNRKEEMKQFKDRGRNDRDRDRFEDEPENNQ